MKLFLQLIAVLVAFGLLVGAATLVVYFDEGHTMSVARDALEQGKAAAHRGESRRSCPYSESLQKRAWLAGYDAVRNSLIDLDEQRQAEEF